VAALTRKWIASPNYSSRGGSSVRLIVVHTAEGATTIESLGNFFANPSAEVSSHTGADDKAGVIGEYVKRGNKAWTAANYNPVAVQIELCAFAKWSTDEWHRHPNMLKNCARWIAEEAAHFGVPITALSPGAAQGSGRGVCQHADLGSGGGGHWDCGGGFPMGYVLDLARGGKPAPPPSGAKPPPAGKAPPLHVDYFGQQHNAQHADVRTWQSQMRARGWSIGVDQIYGPQSEQVCRSFQSEKGLAVDGLVGPQTWSATWTAPVT
jgi:Putative peptidoglycan binding domain/N-acetylmuramoyl-L-alanine amidase